MAKDRIRVLSTLNKAQERVACDPVLKGNEVEVVVVRREFDV